MLKNEGILYNYIILLYYTIIVKRDILYFFITFDTF